MSSSKNIIYFDGECGLCDKIVQYICTRNEGKTLFFAPLQGKTAQKYLEKRHTQNISTVIFQTKDNNTFTKSDAILEIYRHLPYHKPFLIFKIIPRPIRDFFYDIVAKHRKKVTSQTCAWRDRNNECFLD